MDVARDVLDEAVVDRDGRPMGRVDGVLIAVRPRCPPTLSAILIGPSVLGHRVHPLLGRLISAVEHALGLFGRPVEIGFDRVTQVDGEIIVDLPASDTSVDDVEFQLRRLASKIREIA
jgi:hypothetical protein